MQYERPLKTIVVFHPSTFLDSTTQKVHLQRNQPHGLPTYQPKCLATEVNQSEGLFNEKGHFDMVSQSNFQVKDPPPSAIRGRVAV